MPTITLIDYGCHSFSYRLAARLCDSGISARYFVNGSLESPNLSSLSQWVEDRPEMVRNITCKKPYGKMSLAQRLRGEAEWAVACVKALEEEEPDAVIVSCLPLTVVTRIEAWCQRRKLPFIYWLQDIQGRAIYDLLKTKWGFVGRVIGGLAYIWEQELLDRSRMVITIAPDHEQELPLQVVREKRFRLLENWGNLDDFPRISTANDWAKRHGLDQTVNVMYTGTLGLKHDLNTFYELAQAFRGRPEVRVVIVSSGQAAGLIREEASQRRLTNLLVLPFQPHEDVPSMLASAAVLIAPLDPSAGSFCVPSKILSYLCAGRPTVLAIDSENLAARTLERSSSGLIVEPGNSAAFIAAVTKLIDDPALRFETGANARAYAENAFNLDLIVETFMDILAQAGIPFPPNQPSKPEPDFAHSSIM